MVFDPIRSGNAPTPIVALDEVDSTNTEAARRAQAGARGPLWITAQHQTRGKGRSGRSFQSPAGGNLYATLLLNLAVPAASLPQLSLLAGVAACDAIRSIAGEGTTLGVRLKWPNDVLVGDAKLVGILAETTAANPQALGATTIIIGWGINLALAPTNLDRPTTSLAAHGVTVTPDDMLKALDSAVFRWLEAWAGGSNFTAVRDAWLRHAGAVGERLVVNRGNGPLEGIFAGLDDDGALLLADASGRPQRVTYGDVTLPDPIRRTESSLRDTTS